MRTRHGSDSRIERLDELRGGYLCTTKSTRVSREYGEVVHTLEVDEDSTIVDIDELEVDGDVLEKCRHLDRSETVEQLRERGVDGVRHDDIGPPSWPHDHETIRIINPDVVEIVEVTTPPCIDCGEQFGDWQEWDRCEDCV